ncbi:SulP family inorganic anion transporter [Caldimonas sp. KR1-144]|uniref:SulP family inorganic anion transporter n=1 Tax=Caldimonas sp. KR1-144 TaxID=3400911 RepID=UPI003C01ED8F
MNLQRFRPRLLDSLHGYDRHRLFADLGAGITVGIVALPLAMAFAIASGLKPEQGLFTAIIAGFLIAALGGSNVQIGGPAGAFIVIVYGIVERYGLANLLIATMLAGVLLFAFGLLRLGGMVRFIPVSIVIGFTNGIAVLIALSQVKDLLGLSIDKLPADFFSQIGTLASHLDSFNPAAFAIGAGTAAGLFLWPRLWGGPAPLVGALTAGRAGRIAARTPGPIIALVSMTALVAWLELPVETIGSRFGGIPRALPAFDFPEFSWATVKQLFIPTLTIALLGAVESLLCARVADNVSELPRHDPNQELMAQGIANFVVPWFGGMPATGTIARTVTNVRAGASTPVSGMVHAATLLAIVLVAAPLASAVPLAVLAGILLFAAWNMGEWREFARLRHFSLGYRTILLGTFALTVIFDLTVAVEVGLVLACVFFIWRMGSLFRVEPLETGAPAGVVVRRLYGALFFGAVGRLERLAEELPADARVLVLEMHQLISMDSSGLDALEQLERALARRGIELRLAAPNEQPASLMRRAGFAQRLGDARIAPDLASALSASTAAPCASA